MAAGGDGGSAPLFQAVILTNVVTAATIRLATAYRHLSALLFDVVPTFWIHNKTTTVVIIVLLITCFTCSCKQFNLPVGAVVVGMK